MRSIRLTSAVAAVALFAAVGTASAAVDFDPENGTGFVGKGDVQLALGMNNAQIQNAALSLEFTLVEQEEFELACDKVTPGTTIHQTRTKTSEVNSAVEYDARTRRQVTGFILTGLGDETVQTEGSCPGGFTEISSTPVPNSSFTELQVNGVTIASF
jgi:hypothetical protein